MQTLSNLGFGAVQTCLDLSNEYFIAKIGVDTAENKPLEVLEKLKLNSIFIRLLHRDNFSGYRQTDRQAGRLANR